MRIVYVPVLVRPQLGGITMCVCVWVGGFVIAFNRGRKCDTLHSDRGRFENGDGPHPGS